MGITDLAIRWRDHILALSWVWWLVGPAHAELVEKYAPWYIDNEYPEQFLLIGDVDSRTALNFDRAVDEFGIPEILLLSSDGGLVGDALVVARRAKGLGVATLVPSGMGCYSSCALIFLAGRPRVVDGLLGVHQISSRSGDLVSGQVAISDILDVLGEFDVPNDLIVAMFRTPPEEMHILSEEEKFAFGFLLRSEEARNEKSGPSLEQLSAEFIVEINKRWSLENGSANAAIAETYGDQVTFFGVVRDKQDVLAEKNDFTTRWPVRNYFVDGSSISVSCIGTLCNVSANVRWLAVSPQRGKTSKGLAFQQLTLDFFSGEAVVVGEDGHVIERY